MRSITGSSPRGLGVLAACLALVVSVFTPAPASAVGQAAPEATPAAAATAKVIVTFRGRPGKAEQAAVKAAGGTVKRAFTVIDAVAAEMPPGKVAALRRNPLVKHVETDWAIRTFEHPSSPYNLEYANAWGVDHIGARRAHEAGTRGAGVGVAVIDTGLDYIHDVPPSGEPPVVDPEFLSNYAGGVDIFNGDNDPMDDNGHGTHVSGSLAAELNGYLVAGVAPEVDLYAVKILNQSGEGEYSHLIAGLQWVVDYNVAHPGAIDVVNMSVGAHEVSQALADAVANAYSTGLILVAAAGNIDPGNIFEIIYGCPVAYPAAYPQVLSTTFTNEQNSLTGWSCTGTEVDFAAPGDAIASTVPVGTCLFCSPNGYAFLSGTSMASPHLAGAVALVLSKGIADGNENGLLFDDVRAHLCANTMPGAMPQNPANYAKWYGCGVVSAGKSIVDNPPPPPGPANTPPDAVDDSATVTEDGSVDIPVLANDTDANGDPRTVAAVGAATKGTPTNLGTGFIRYVPDANAVGLDSFTYTITDGRGGFDTATVGVTITPVNDPPTAVDDTATTNEDTAVAVNVLANDTDPDAGDTLTVTSVTDPPNGTAVIGSGGTVIYTPDLNWPGPADSFGYAIRDAAGSTATSTVSITVNPVNDLPTAQAETVSTPNATPVSITLSGVDVETCPMTFAIVPGSGPVNGTLGPLGAATCSTQTSRASITYTPTGQFTGNDIFRFRVTDAAGAASEASVSISVGEPTGPPPATSVHVGDLDRSASAGGKNWTARVTITVHDSNHTPVIGAVVSGRWSVSSATVSCTTTASGTCTLSRAISNSRSSVTFSVRGIGRTLPYLSSANHDPETDSDGTSITVSKPV